MALGLSETVEAAGVTKCSNAEALAVREEAAPKALSKGAASAFRACSKLVPLAATLAVTEHLAEDDIASRLGC